MHTIEKGTNRVQKRAAGISVLTALHAGNTGSNPVGDAK